MFSRLSVWLLLAATIASPAHAAERNAWPFWVGQEDAATGRLISQQILGPLYETQINPDDSTQQVLRPLWLKTTHGDKTKTHLLYPFFTWQRDATGTSFTFFQLINRLSEKPQDGSGSTQRLDVWPFYFSRDTGDPASSYHALFPIAGTIKNRFGKDRLTWYLFPLYFNTDKAGMQITSAPWPFIRIINGADHHGFEFWPLFGSREHPGDYHNQFYLWPLVYKYEAHLSAPQPDVKLGVLPFYSRETSPGYQSETYAWPFFGYTHRTSPEKYDETRYFWPFLVQGRGDQRYVNRFAPFYTHSIVKGYDKTWLFWPLYRHARWSENDIVQEKNVVLFFLYSSVEQRSLTNPAAVPAYKTQSLAGIQRVGQRRRPPPDPGAQSVRSLLPEQ